MKNRYNHSHRDIAQNSLPNKILINESTANYAATNIINL